MWVYSLQGIAIYEYWGYQRGGGGLKYEILGCMFWGFENRRVPTLKAISTDHTHVT